MRGRSGFERHDASRAAGSRGPGAAMAWVAATIAVLCLSSPAMAQSTGQFERTLQVSGPVDLDVSTGAGNITIRTGNDDTVEVRGRISARSGWRGDRDRAEELVRDLEQHPPIEQTGNTIRIGDLSERDRRERVSISYELVVPVQTRVDARTGAGRQEIDGIEGPLEAHAGSGGLEISNIANDVRAQAGSGALMVEAVQGDVDLRAGSGEIRARGIVGDLTARTGSGGIRAEGTPDREWSLRAGSGSLEVDVPDDAGFDLRAETNSGSIDSTHPITVQGRMTRHRLEGQVRGGGFRLELRSGSGSITIR